MSAVAISFLGGGALTAIVTSFVGKLSKGTVPPDSAFSERHEGEVPLIHIFKELATPLLAISAAMNTCIEAQPQRKSYSITWWSYLCGQINEILPLVMKPGAQLQSADLACVETAFTNAEFGITKIKNMLEQYASESSNVRITRELEPSFIEIRRILTEKVSHLRGDYQTQQRIRNGSTAI